MNKYFSTELITVYDNERIDIYNIEHISEDVGHHIETLTISNDGLGDIVIMSKIGYKWNKVILHERYVIRIKDMSEVRIISHKDSKYRVTEFIVVQNGIYIE